MTAPNAASGLVPYTYRATVRRVVDGDTIRVDVDLGFGLVNRGEDAGGLSVRILGINARESYQAGGPEAKAHLEQLLPIGARVLMRTVKVDKYGGRYDAAVELPDGRDLAATLVGGGWASAWDGVGSRPLPPWPREGAA